VNRLFSTLNWTLTEFTVAVGELHNLRGQRSILEVQNQYRRTGLMFELSVNFLRLLEFVVVSGTVCLRWQDWQLDSLTRACALLVTIFRPASGLFAAVTQRHPGPRMYSTATMTV
jgi:hypothetical protein